MRKTLKVILIIITLLILIYSGLWALVLFSLSNSINQKYAGIYINVEEFNNNEKYFIKFSKVKPSGFPFKFGISIIDWSEESINRKIEFNSPINIGYDLLKQNLFINFSGESLGRFKPIERGFGVKFYNSGYNLSAKIPLNFKLLKIITQKKELFEAVNLIEDVKFIAGRTEIFDLVDGQKLYDEGYTRFIMSFDKSKYYTSKEDFLNNIPKKLEIDCETEIIQSNLENRTIPAGLLLYRLAWHDSFKFSGNLTVTTDNSSFEDLAKDLRIKVTNAKISSNSFENNVNLLYKGKLDDKGNNNVNLLIDSRIKLKQDSIAALLNTVKTYYNKQAYLLKLSNTKLYEDFNQEIEHILNNNNRSDFKVFEDREYDFNLNVNLVTELNKLTRAQINSLGLYSKGSGFNITNETIVNIHKNSYSKGVIIFNNYAKIIDILSPYLYGLGKFKAFSEESREVYKNGLKLFLKAISDYPNSSNLVDISFDYEFNLSDLNKTKIGTIDDINKIIPLYYLSLYQSAIKKVKIGDDLKEKVQELIPDFREHQKILEQCMLPGFQEVNENFWQELTK